MCNPDSGMSPTPTLLTSLEPIHGKFLSIRIMKMSIRCAIVQPTPYGVPFMQHTALQRRLCAVAVGSVDELLRNMWWRHYNEDESGRNSADQRRAHVWSGLHHRPMRYRSLPDRLQSGEVVRSRLGAGVSRSLPLNLSCCGLVLCASVFSSTLCLNLMYLLLQLCLFTYVLRDLHSAMPSVATVLRSNCGTYW